MRRSSVTLLNPEDHRFTAGERHQLRQIELRQIVLRLQNGEPATALHDKQQTDLEDELNRVFGE